MPQRRGPSNRRDRRRELDNLTRAMLLCVSSSGGSITTLAGREQTRVGGVFYTDDVVTEPFAYRNGCLTIPSGPGLGVDLDAVKIERYRVA